MGLEAVKSQTSNGVRLFDKSHEDNNSNYTKAHRSKVDPAFFICRISSF